ncbi:MAG: endonuclease/exonuclease/phosphatase family protein [Gammaproteobacteria bacterium]
MKSYCRRYRQFPRTTALAVAGAAALLAACSARAPVTDTPATLAATAALAPPVITRDRGERDTLAGDHIRLLVWNVHKGSDDEWIGDFRTMAADSDLVLLQEAHLHEEFTSGLVGLPRWDLVQAWRWRRAPTGVLTASDAAPLSVRALEAREPLLRTDKSALVTEYRLAGSEQSLLVANVHAINFTVDTRAFRAQLAAVAELIAAHNGPAILSGDLNTWRDARRQIVQEFVAQLQLQEVAFDGPRKQFGRFPLDHVYYRGLELLSSEVPAVGSSDHNPLLVTFRHPAATTLAQLSADTTGISP